MADAVASKLFVSEDHQTGSQDFKAHLEWALTFGFIASLHVCSCW